MSERPVEMRLQGSAMTRHPAEARVPQGLPERMIIFAIDTSGLILWDKKDARIV